MREALIVWGGWNGHEPERCAGIVAGMLEEEGFKVHVDDDRGFHDPGARRHEPHRADLQMAKIEKKEVENLTRASAAASYWRVSTAACVMPSATHRYHFVRVSGFPSGNIIDYA